LAKPHETHNWEDSKGWSPGAKSWATVDKLAGKGQKNGYYRSRRTTRRVCFSEKVTIKVSNLSSGTGFRGAKIREIGGQKNASGLKNRTSGKNGRGGVPDTKRAKG